MAIYNISINASVNTASVKAFKTSISDIRRDVKSINDSFSCHFSGLISNIPADLEGDTPLSWRKNNFTGDWTVECTVADLREFNGKETHHSFKAFKSAMNSLEANTFLQYCKKVWDDHTKATEIDRLLEANNLKGKTPTKKEVRMSTSSFTVSEAK